MKRHPRLRIACTSTLWLAVGIIYGRQDEQDEVRDAVRDLSDRVRELEDRPTLKITVDDEMNAEVSDDND